MSPSKTISLDQFRAKKKKEENTRQIPGTMVWLHCPTCGTTEYTEIVAPHGRTHRCGTVVQEVMVQLDLRAEVTITRFNLQKIEALRQENNSSKLRKLFAKSLDNALIKLKASEETYLERLNATQIPPYEGELEILKDQLPIKEVNKLGLLVSEFRYKPEDRFPKT